MIKRDLSIVVPCYNEAERLPINDYNNFLSKYNDILIVFVNDGSSDNTIQVLNSIKDDYPDQIHILNYEKNRGKANAVYVGFQEIIKNQDSEKIAYLDADLATSLDECLRLSNFINENIKFVFASRILTLDNNIKRKWYRFFIGRIISTAISNTLRLTIYDTQCGCKIFHKEIADSIFKESFISKWLFDVEIFFRAIRLFGRENIHKKVKEAPLKEWIDTPDSKVSPLYFFKLWKDLYDISRRYK